MAVIPSQRRRCATYAWCTVPSRRHRVHTGEGQTLVASTGARLRVSLSAENGQDPAVQLEASYGPDEPMLEIADLTPAEAVELAGIFLRLARDAHAEHQPNHHHR